MESMAGGVDAKHCCIEETTITDDGDTDDAVDDNDDVALLVVEPQKFVREIVTEPGVVHSTTRHTDECETIDRWKYLKRVNQFYQVIQRKLAKLFFYLGWSLATYPWSYLASCTFICAILSAGCIDLSFDDDVTLWYPRNTVSYRDYRFRNNVFGLDNGTAIAIVTLNQQPSRYSNGTYENQGILTRSALEEVTSLYTTLSSAQLQYNHNYSYASHFCARNCALLNLCHCKTSSILSVFAVTNASAPEKEPHIVLPSSDSQIIDQIISRPVTSNIPVLEIVLGGIQYKSGHDSSTGAITFADAAMLRFELSDEVEKPDMAQWEKLFRETCSQASKNFTVISVSCETDDEQSIETDQALADDQTFIIIAMSLMIVYVSTVLGKRDCVNSRYALSLSVIIMVGMSLGVGFGISGFMEYPLTQVSFMAVFILFGIGIDDMFLIVDSVDRHEHVGGLQLRCSLALEEIGASIMYTSLTTFVALMVSTMIDLPAIQAFAFVAGFAVLSIFFITVFGFVPLLVLNFRRIAQRRCDVLPCVVVRRSQLPSVRRPDIILRQQDNGSACSRREIPHSQTSHDSPALSMAHTGPEHGGAVRRLMVKYYIPWLTGTYAKDLVPICFVLLVMGFGMYGVTQVNKNFDATDYLPANSPLKHFFIIENAHFGSVGEIDFLISAPDLNNHTQVDSLCELHRRINALDFTIKTPMETSWVPGYASYYGAVSMSPDSRGWPWGCASNSAAPVFTPDVNDSNRSLIVEFLSLTSIVSDNGALQAQFRFDNSEAGVPNLIAAKIPVITNNTAMYGRNYAIKKESLNAAKNLSFEVYPVTMEFLAEERTMMIDTLTVHTVCSTVFAVFGVSLLMLSPVESLLIMLCVVMVIFDVVGLMAAWDVDLNVTSVVFLCIAVGFSVDYSAHIAKSVSEQNVKLPNTKRVALALEKQGVAVLHAGLSTFVAVIVLSAAKSKGYIVLFKMLFGTVVFGVAHGLCFLPACLMLLPAWTTGQT
eukprot:m.918110 g.918110  ORF g.918110 m.918110 type:complete len:994 (-) comp23740_c0_seq2:282-3263(-)